jgi:hypothetical protein
MLWDNLALSLGDVVRPEPNTNLNHLFVVSGLSAVLCAWHKMTCECGLIGIRPNRGLA